MIIMMHITATWAHKRYLGKIVGAKEQLTAFNNGVIKTTAMGVNYSILKDDQPP
jgi:hypothetical protein